MLPVTPSSTIIWYYMEQFQWSNSLGVHKIQDCIHMIHYSFYGRRFLAGTGANFLIIFSRSLLYVYLTNARRNYWNITIMQIMTIKSEYLKPTSDAKFELLFWIAHFSSFFVFWDRTSYIFLPWKTCIFSTDQFLQQALYYGEFTNYNNDKHPRSEQPRLTKE